MLNLEPVNLGPTFGVDPTEILGYLFSSNRMASSLPLYGESVVASGVGGDR